MVPDNWKQDYFFLFRLMVQPEMMRATDIMFSFCNTLLLMRNQLNVFKQSIF